MKYFEIDGKQCRGLPFDKDLLGSNRNTTNKNNVFIKITLPKDHPKYKDITSEKLDEMFSKFGSVKSAKLSINGDYSSRGYGFVCFNDPSDVEKAVKEAASLGDVDVKPF
jgi:RNA recognition motif-containing protein